jgi:hypothetical protein
MAASSANLQESKKEGGLALRGPPSQDHRPDAERPQDVLRAEPLFLGKWIVLTFHDAPPRFLFVMRTTIAGEF